MKPFTGNPPGGPPAPTREPRILGTPVDPDRHGGAYRRPPPPPEPEPPPPPLVPCRDAAPEEIDATAARIVKRATEAGIPVRVTYAMGGTWRRGGDRGVCTCGATPLLLVDTGMLRSHSTPVSPCPGTEIQYGFCATCGRKATAKKDGTPRAHTTPPKACPGTNPDRIVPGERIDPEHSIVVRISGIGVGIWVDGTFSGAYLRGPTHWVPASFGEFNRAVP